MLEANVEEAHRFLVVFLFEEYPCTKLRTCKEKSGEREIHLCISGEGSEGVLRPSSELKVEATLSRARLCVKQLNQESEQGLMASLLGARTLLRMAVPGRLDEARRAFALRSFFPTPLNR